MDDEGLLAATAAGDADAFAVFYRRHLALVVGFGVRATGDREAAADLTGEVFAAALAGCARYRAEHETAAPWLIGIAHNKLRESRRRGRVQDAVRRRLQMRPLELDADDLERVEALASAAGSTVLAAVRSCPRPNATRSGLESSMTASTESWQASSAVRSRSSANASAEAWQGSGRVSQRTRSRRGEHECRLFQPAGGGAARRGALREHRHPRQAALAPASRWRHSDCRQPRRRSRRHPRVHPVARRTAHAGAAEGAAPARLYARRVFLSARLDSYSPPATGQFRDSA